MRDDFTPLSSGLILSKVLIVFDEIVTTAKSPGGSETEEASHHVVMDYTKMTENLFFRVFECQTNEESLVYDQLDLFTRSVQSPTGQPPTPVGQVIVNVDVKVQNDF